MQEPEPSDAAAPPKKKKSATKTVVIAVVTFLVIICGAGIFFAQPRTDSNDTRAVIDSVGGAMRSPMPVVVAAKELNGGDVVSDADVQVEARQDGSFPEWQESIASKEHVVGHVLKQDVKAGKAITVRDLFPSYVAIAVAAKDLKANTKLKASNLKSMPPDEARGYYGSKEDISKCSLIGKILEHDVRAGKVILPTDIASSSK